MLALVEEEDLVAHSAKKIKLGLGGVGNAGPRKKGE